MVLQGDVHRLHIRMATRTFSKTNGLVQSITCTIAFRGRVVWPRIPLVGFLGTDPLWISAE